MHLSRTQFELMVFDVAAKIVASLPDDLRDKAGNVMFAVEDRPTREQMESVEDDGDTGDDLLGLYEGTPLTERTIDDMRIVPDRITLFRIPLLDMCRSRKELHGEIRLTIIHELAHFFGFEERDLEERGLG